MNKIAAIQLCSTRVIDDNLATVAGLIADAADKGAQLVVLPEMFACFGQDPSHILLLKEQPGAGKIQDFLADIALKYNLWIVGGTLPLRGDHPHKFRAACLIFDNQGNQVARYDKIHLFDAQLSAHESYQESATTQPGQHLTVVDTPVGKLGVCVCFDIRFPTHCIELASRGAEIIAIPAAFTLTTGQAHWETLIRCRALDSFCYMVGACQGGTHDTGRQTFGHAMIVDPWGTILDQVINPASPIAYADIDLAFLYQVRDKIPRIAM